MAFLEKLTDEEKDLVVSLPYCAGIFISQSDTTGDYTADFDERRALAEIIDAASSAGLFGSALVHEVMAEVSSRRSDWPQWEKHEDPLPHAKKVASILKSKMSVHDANAYKHSVMEVANETAKAFGEFDYTADGFTKLTRHLQLSIDWLIGLIKREHYESRALLNISLEEDKALAALAEALEYRPEMALVPDPYKE